MYRKLPVVRVYVWKSTSTWMHMKSADVIDVINVCRVRTVSNRVITAQIPGHLIHSQVCAVTPSYVRAMTDCRVCNMTPSYGHDSLSCVCHDSFLYVCHDSLSCVCHDSFWRVGHDWFSFVSQVSSKTILHKSRLHICIYVFI